MKKVLFLAGLLVLAMASQCSQKNTFSPGTPFSLKIGEAAESADGSIGIMFDGVKEDSRCPKNVNCIQAGRAIITLSAMEGKQTYSAELTLEEGKSSEKMLGQYRCRLQQLDPWPEADKRTDLAAYVATLLIEKK